MAGPSQEGPYMPGWELRVCGEVSREPERFILPGPTWSDVPLRKLAWMDVGRMDYCKWNWKQGDERVKAPLPLWKHSRARLKQWGQFAGLQFNYLILLGVSEWWNMVSAGFLLAALTPTLTATCATLGWYKPHLVLTLERFFCLASQPGT